MEISLEHPSRSVIKELETKFKTQRIDLKLGYKFKSYWHIDNAHLFHLIT